MLKRYNIENEYRKIIKGIIEEFKSNVSKRNSSLPEKSINMYRLLQQNSMLTLTKCIKTLDIPKNKKMDNEEYIQLVIEQLDSIIAYYSSNFENMMSLMIKVRIDLLMPSLKQLIVDEYSGLDKLIKIMKYKADLIDTCLLGRKYNHELSYVQKKQLDNFCSKYANLESIAIILQNTKKDNENIKQSYQGNLFAYINKFLSNDYKVVVCTLLETNNLNNFEKLVKKYAIESDKIWDDICQNIKRSFSILLTKIRELDDEENNIINNFKIKSNMLEKLLLVDSKYAEKLCTYMELSNNSIIKIMKEEMDKKVLELKMQRFKNRKLTSQEKEIVELFISSKQTLECFVLEHGELNITVSKLQTLILYYEFYNKPIKNIKIIQEFNLASYLNCEETKEVEFILWQNENKVLEVMEKYGNTTKREHDCAIEYKNSDLKMFLSSGKEISFSQILKYFKKFYPISYEKIKNNKNILINNKKEQEKIEYMEFFISNELKYVDELPYFLGDIQSFQNKFQISDEKMEQILEYISYKNPELFKQIYEDIKHYEEDICSEYMTLIMEIANLVGKEHIPDEKIYVVALKEYHNISNIKIEELLGFIWNLKRNKKEFYEENKLFLDPAYRFCSQWTDVFMKLKISAQIFNKKEYMETVHNLGTILITEEIVDSVLHILDSYEIPRLNIFVKEALQQYTLDLACHISFEESNLKQYIESLSFDSIKNKVLAL